MTALLILIPVALFLGALGLAAFLWSMKSGQFDDLDGAAARILNDEEMGNDRAGNMVGVVTDESWLADPNADAPEKKQDLTGRP